MVELYTALVAFLAIFNFCLGIYLWLNPKTPGARTAGLFAFAVAGVCLMFDLLMHASSPETAYVYARLRFIGLAALNPLLLIFALQYTRQTQWLKPLVIPALFIIPVITQFVLWLTPAHTEFFLEWQVIRLDDHWIEVRKFGGWYYAHAFYGGLLLAMAMLLLIWYIRRVDSSRLRDLYLFLGLVAFTVFGVTTAATIGPPPGLNLTPLVLGISSLSLGWLLAAGNTVRVMPVAYDVVFSNIGDAVLVIDRKDRVVNANPAAVALLKRERSALLNKPVESVMGGLKGWSAGQGPFQVTVPQGQSALIYEVRHLPLLRGAEDLGSLIVLHDVTGQQKSLELAIERERGRIVSKFISDASHEFRTPLSIIKSSAYLLGRSAAPEKGAHHVTKINDHVDRINALVNDLQVMASLDSDRPLDREPIDLRRLVMAVTEGSARPLAELRGQTLTTEISGGLPLLQGDDSELTLALQKILHNAIRYTPEGGTIAVDVRPDGKDALITVKDNGVGMDMATAQAAVQRFYRLDVARSTSGFGLGLPIAQKVMERHGGTLTIESAPESGTTVTLRLR